ncbi:hypothetical protein RDV84_23770 [Lysobacter yananisis]|uniref:Uncharacterized protein n=1 Tax=Lysobacter yananisis TaxID=1003114 RepID=A0ABY9P7I5_9GAMM|nr:hypothetical protein [Lysobacter yananisis]WMT02944.1 hypothetical protein RDV84_23770 [Lysobacter yananisis]
MSTLLAPPCCFEGAGEGALGTPPLGTTLLGRLIRSHKLRPLSATEKPLANTAKSDIAIAVNAIFFFGELVSDELSTDRLLTILIPRLMPASNMQRV